MLEITLRRKLCGQCTELISVIQGQYVLHTSVSQKLHRLSVNVNLIMFAHVSFKNVHAAPWRRLRRLSLRCSAPVTRFGARLDGILGCASSLSAAYQSCL